MSCSYFLLFLSEYLKKKQSDNDSKTNGDFVILFDGKTE